MKPVRVPSQKILEGITAVRDSGLVNMLAVTDVARAAQKYGFTEAAKWIRANMRDYSEGVFMGFFYDSEFDING